MANHLKRSKSRYLLQHADNPVDWYPWSDEPFERAAAESKPLLVSIGYSSCHWCHVMAHDCFEDEEIAGILNESFVSIKVDKEELPDVDGFYMEFLTRLSGRGGWPLNVFVNPNRSPFYGTSYLPPLDFVELLRYIADQYSREEKIRSQKIERHFAVGSLSAEQIRNRLAAIDPPPLMHESGPQFPQAPYLLFALRRGERAKVRGELEHLITKGLFDHIEGGWFRYSVDPTFRIPHFEKMLYDQATLLLLCAEARPLEPELCDYAIRATLRWLEGHMRLPSGLYGSATDADTAEGEGFYYTEPEKGADASPADDPESGGLAEAPGRPGNAGTDGAFVRGGGLEQATGTDAIRPEPAADFERALFRRDECGEHEGRFLPWIDLELYARERARSEDLLERCRERRRGRQAPALDAKAVVSWNCLLGYALLRCAAATGDHAVEEVAERLFRSIEPFMADALPHVIYGLAPLPGPLYLEDSAAGLLFATEREKLGGGNARRSGDGGAQAARDGKAAVLLEAIRSRFIQGSYLFHTTERRFESLSLWQDSPFPSGGAMLLTALLDLEEPDAERLSRLAIAEVAAANPTFFGMWCAALDRAYGIGGETV